MEFHQFTDAEMYVRIVDGKIADVRNVAAPESSQQSAPWPHCGLAIVFDPEMEFEPDALIAVQKDGFTVTYNQG
ncbi:hypothetical protein [Mesorhizobium sp.]|uniref:hypothetical protein n=1 Tax=Mesorhizobium sp. TaxID=1871066 RepID=UPI0011FB575E|nr:hypothetical protein [Mesorhizobium sp.]TIS67992.1 MAG: hypothetical protein E5W92_06325 [Mesorhizobium sp.]